MGSTAGVIIWENTWAGPFAAAVRDAYLAAGPKGQARRVIAKSPVTGQSYTMNCLPEEEIVVCRGGNGAVVHIY